MMQIRVTAPEEWNMTIPTSNRGNRAPRGPQRKNAAMLLWMALFAPAGVSAERVAFYYGREVPESRIDQDWIVLQPDQVDSGALGRLQARGTRPIAYLSVGEVAHSAAEHVQVREEWVIGHNAGWASDVLDIRRRDVQQWLVDSQAGAAWSQGYRGFFLDTLDSYRLAAIDDKALQEKAFQAALVSIVRQLDQRYPDAVILLNRGFDIVPAAHRWIDGIAFESLYSRYDVANDRYESVPEADRQWLLGKVQPLREAYGLPVVAIDYTAPEATAEAQRVLDLIESHGLQGWVCDGHLSRFGIGSGESK